LTLCCMTSTLQAACETPRAFCVQACSTRACGPARARSTCTPSCVACACGVVCVCDE
jgi:hypothetical protein